MKKSVLLTTLVWLMVTSAFGQNEVTKFGKVSPEEMKMEIYPKDSSAEAVFLFDEGNVEVYFDDASEKWLMKFERHGRIKILTKEGLDQANLEIPLYSEGDQSERISQFGAIVFNEEKGKVVKSKVGLRDGVTENVEGNYSKKKFAFPDCKVGSVIDFQYSISSNYLSSLHSWQFQHTIPVIYSSYTVIIPEYFHYNTYPYGFESYSHIDLGSLHKSVSVTHHEATMQGKADSGDYGYTVDYMTSRISYIAKDVPALKKSEVFVDNIDNYLTRLEFELAQYSHPGHSIQTFSTTWEEVTKTLLQNDYFGQQLSGGGYMDDDISALKVGTTPEDKILNTFNFIRSKVKWNNSYRLIVKDGVRRAYKDGGGNSAEVNLNLVIALRKVGLTAFPVVLSTRGNGVVNPGRPTLSNFNNVIAEVVVGDKTYLLDATSRFSDVNVLPFADLNGQGRVVDENHAGWISLDPSFISKLRSSGSFTISTNGELEGDLQQIFSDYFATFFQTAFGEADAEAKVEKQIKKDFTSDVADSLKITYGEKGSPMVTVKVHLKPDGVVSVAGDLMYIDPCVGFGNTTNPFVDVNRKFPINFGMPREETYMNQFVVPEGYTVEDLPKPMTIVLPNNGGKFIYSCALNGKVLVVVSRLTIPNSVYAPLDYPNIKEFFNQIATKLQQKVVLKKI